MERILINFDRNSESYLLSSYLKRDGYSSLKNLFSRTPQQIIDEVKKADVKGRGGAGFSAGVKWGFIPKDSGKPVYLCCNADEGEPGTFKDKVILEENPHMLIEGMICASYAIGAKYAYVYIRGEYDLPYARVQNAVDEAYEAGYLGENIQNSGFSCHVVLFKGAGAYVCGDETSLLNSIEGRKGYPRIKPPFPAITGLYGCPTIINNVETLANIPWIVNNGGAAFKNIGTQVSSGTKLFSVSGHIKRPGVYEIVMGYPFETFLYEDCGGIVGDKKLKAVIPGGSSSQVLRADETKGMKLCFESIAERGSMLGSGGMIIIAEGTCMVNICQILAKFYANESCGQCTPCREGTRWMSKIVDRIEYGRGEFQDIETLRRLFKMIESTTICPLGDAAVWPIRSFLDKYLDEFKEHIRIKRCPNSEHPSAHHKLPSVTGVLYD